MLILGWKMITEVVFSLREPHFWKSKIEEAIYNIACPFKSAI